MHLQTGRPDPVRAFAAAHRCLAATKEVKFHISALREHYAYGDPGEPNEPGRRLHAATPDAIQAFAAAEAAILNSLSAALTNLANGILALDAMIVAFQNSPGTLSSADQTALNAISAQSTALVTQANAITTAAPTAPVPVTPIPVTATP
jgi:hypothetical protein